jgi:mevalonate pyrophosphate decarboxylase
MKRKLVSLICPVLNEQENIETFYREVNAVISELADDYDFEFVFTDTSRRSRQRTRGSASSASPRTTVTRARSTPDMAKPGAMPRSSWTAIYRIRPR